MKNLTKVFVVVEEDSGDIIYASTNYDIARSYAQTRFDEAVKKLLLE